MCYQMTIYSLCKTKSLPLAKKFHDWIVDHCSGLYGRLSWSIFFLVVSQKAMILFYIMSKLSFNSTLFIQYVEKEVFYLFHQFQLKNAFPSMSILATFFQSNSLIYLSMSKQRQDYYTIKHARMSHNFCYNWNDAAKRN